MAMRMLGAQVHETLGESEAKFHVVPYESGRYRFCLTLSAVGSRHTLARDVIWDLHVASYHAVDSDKQHIKEKDTEVGGC